MSSVAIGTICARNFLAHANVLADSVNRYHPGIPVYLFVPDIKSGDTELDNANVHILGLVDLDVKNIDSLLFAYDRKQFLVSVKPTLIRLLLQRGFSSVLFLDPDMLLLADLDEALTQIASHALTLTPHLHMAPTLGNRVDRERWMLLAGIYNGGFIGASDRSEAHQFLTWWENRLREHCDIDLKRGLHYDQRWLDLAPGFVEDLNILTDPALNTAYWNLPDFNPQLADNTLIVSGQPCRLFHFSGYSPNRHGEITSHRPSLETHRCKPTEFILDLYRQKLLDAGYESTGQAPWPWNSFSNGVEITPEFRKRYRSLGEKAIKFGDPFNVDGKGSYFNWLKTTLDDEQSDEPSDEKFIIDCYDVYLGRPPSTGEINAWCYGLWSRAEVTRLITQSDSQGLGDHLETVFTRISDNRTRTFVAKMYFAFFDRLVDSGGLEYWTSVFDTAHENTGIEGVRGEAGTLARSVMSSEEYLSKKPTREMHVVKLHVAFVGRRPTGDEVEYWTNELVNAGQTMDSLIDKLSTSTDFTTRLQTFFD